MATQKLVGLTAIVLVLGLAPITCAAEIKASLKGTRFDPSAQGHASWISRPYEINFSIEVETVSVDGLAYVYVDGELSGVLDVIRGGSRIESKLKKTTSPDFLRVKPGSIVEVYSSDNELIMQGAFRR